jgi:ABC-type antimicrobial peptide transport system permease subunit
MTLRTEIPPGSLASAVRGIFHDLDRDVPVYRIHPMEELIDESLAPRTLSMLLLGLFAALAVLLAAFGIYSVISYSITQRTQEIGVRRALGAWEGDVVRMVVREAGVVALLGITIGLAAAFALTRLIAGLLFDVSSTDPASFAGTAVLLTLVALAAGYIPARRAARVDPVIALRQE